MAVSGLPTRCKTHAHYIAKLALDMIDAANSILIRGQPFKVKLHQYNYIYKLKTLVVKERESPTGPPRRGRGGRLAPGPKPTRATRI